MSLLFLFLLLLVCDSGLTQSFSEDTGCFEDSDVVFLVDGSGSVSSPDFRKVKSFIRSMVKRFRLGPSRTRVGLVQFSSQTSPSILLEQGVKRSVLNQALRGMDQLGGGTNTGAALQFVARDFFSNSTRSNFLVLITDGESQDDVRPASQELRRLGVKTYVIGFGSADVSEMKFIASSPYHSFFVPSTDGLDALIPSLCSPGLVQSFSDDTGCFEDSDVVFLVDGSGSVSPSDFTNVKSFVGSMINRFSLGPSRTRVGLVQFSSLTSSSILLEQGVTRSVLDQALRGMGQLGGGTNTGAALQFVARDFFSHSSRSKVLVLITDGESQDDVGPASQELRRLGVNTYVIGFGSADVSEIKFIASSPRHSVFVPSTDGLDALIPSLCSPGLVQSFSHDTGCFEDSDVVFLVDGSGSIYPQDFRNVKSFIGSMINRFSLGPNRTRVGLVQFSSHPETSILLEQGDTRSVLDQQLTGMDQRGGGTNTGAALQFVARDFFSNSSRSNFLVLITDGESEDDVGPASRELRRLGVNTCVIGFGSVHVSEMLTIASSPRHSLFVPSTDGLDALIPSLCSTDVRCKTTAKADIVLLVDGSTSIRQIDFQIMKDFIALMINAFDIGPERVQIGLAQFSTDPKTEWHLNSHPTKASLLQALANLRPMHGDTYTGKALNFVLQNHFCLNVGLRDDAKKILVVITDGESTDRYRLKPQKLRDSGIELFAIGVKNAAENELRSIASDPVEIHMFSVTNFQSLVDILEQLMENLCNSVRGAGPTVTTGPVPARPFVSSGGVSQSSPPGPHSPPPDVGPVSTVEAPPPPDVGEGPVMVERHLDFSVSCFVKPNLLDGRFLLVTPVGNHTLPAVNHSAHFLFPAFSPAHSGAYTCVYLLQVDCGNLTFQGPALRLKLGDSDTKFLIRAAVIFILLLLSTIILYLYYNYYYKPKLTTRGRTSNRSLRVQFRANKPPSSL